MNEGAIKSKLRIWLERSLGEPHTFKITFDADFILGNLIDADFDGELIDQVSFDTDQETTIELLAEEIRKTVKLFKVTVTGPRELTCIGAVNGDDITVTGPTVTGGASQAEATVETITDAAAVPVIYADQSSPRPNYPYAVLRLESIVKVGWDELRSLDDQNIATYGGQRRGSVSIDYFGNNPVQEMTKAANSLEKQSILDLFSSGGIAIQEKNEVLNLTRILETDFEPRASFDFFIGFADNYEDDLGIIESVEIAGEMDEGNFTVTTGPEIIEV